MGIFLVFCQKDFSPLNKEEIINHKIFRKRKDKIKKVNGVKYKKNPKKIIIEHFKTKI